jgi:alpha-1,6-mannosyltransferase
MLPSEEWNLTAPIHLATLPAMLLCRCPSIDSEASNFTPATESSSGIMHNCDLTTLYIDGGEGGVNTYLTEKARYLTERRDGYRHTIIVPGTKNTKRRLYGSTVYTLRSPRFFYNPHHRILTNFHQLKQLLRAAKPDIIEVDCLYFLGHWARSATGSWHVPLVGFYHSHLPSFYAQPLTAHFGPSISRMVESWSQVYVAYCMKPLDKVLVASDDIYGRLIENTDKKVDQVPLGVNLDLFRPREDDIKPHYRRRPMILYVGRLSQEKELGILFEAFRLLNQSEIYQLQIVGDGPLRRETESFVHSTPNAFYAGLVPYGKHLAEFYAAADVLALPSRNETFGLVVLEALASGTPVVAVKQGGPSNLLHPRVGALASPGDPIDFAEKLASLLEDRTKASHCRVYVEQRFSWDKTFVKLLEIYENLYKSSRPTLGQTMIEDFNG